MSKMPPMLALLDNAEDVLIATGCFKRRHRQGTFSAKAIETGWN
jgi:hypothetical protein